MTLLSTVFPTTYATVSDTPPSNPSNGMFWWNSADGQLYIYFVSANSWISANSFAGVGSLAPLISPIFTGSPRVPTPAVGDNTTTISSTAFVNTAIGNATSPLAPLASPTFTGSPSAPTPASGDSSTLIATTLFANNAAAAVAGYPTTLKILGGVATSTSRGQAVQFSNSQAVLANSTVVSGFYMWIKNRTDGFAVNLSCSNTSGTIDGLSSIVIYKEEFLLYYDSVASTSAGYPVYRTQGRQRGWIDYGSFSVAPGTSSVTITAGAGDSEIRDLEIDFENYVGSASNTPNLSIVQGATSSSFVGEYLSGSTTSAAGGQRTGTSSAFGTSTTSPLFGSATLKNIQSTVAYGIRIIQDAAFAGYVARGMYSLSTTGSVASITITPSTGTITSMLYNVRLYRP